MTELAGTLEMGTGGDAGAEDDGVGALLDGAGADTGLEGTGAGAWLEGTGTTVEAGAELGFGTAVVDG